MRVSRARGGKHARQSAHQARTPTSSSSPVLSKISTVVGSLENKHCSATNSSTLVLLNHKFKYFSNDDLSNHCSRIIESYRRQVRRQQNHHLLLSLLTLYCTLVPLIIRELQTASTTTTKSSPSRSTRNACATGTRSCQKPSALASRALARALSY